MKLQIITVVLLLSAVAYCESWSQENDDYFWDFYYSLESDYFAAAPPSDEPNDVFVNPKEDCTEQYVLIYKSFYRNMPDKKQTLPDAHFKVLNDKIETITCNYN
jgi:hypothetical protein